MARSDSELLKFMKEDGLSLEDLKDYAECHILENKSPRLCTDRLDGVLHTCYIWLHTHSLEEIREVYENLVVLKNEDGNNEIGFKEVDVAEKFVTMVYNYAKELQGNRSKFVSKYVADLVKLSSERRLISLENLYNKKEEDICLIFDKNFSSWKRFEKAKKVCSTNSVPQNAYYISYKT